MPGLSSSSLGDIYWLRSGHRIVKSVPAWGLAHFIRPGSASLGRSAQARPGTLYTPAPQLLQLSQALLPASGEQALPPNPTDPGSPEYLLRALGGE